MANYYAYGNAFATAADWLTLAGAAAAEYPGENQADNIFWDARSAEDLDTNPDQSANPSGIENVTVQRGAAYKIATAAAPLTLKLAATPELVFNNDQSGCIIYLVTKTTAVTKCTVNRTGSSKDALHIVFDDVACTLMDILGGNVTLDEYLNELDNLGVATMNVDSGPAGQSPVVTLHAPVTTALNIYGGTVYWMSGTITKLNLYGGSFISTKSTRARTLTNADVYGGMLDLRTGLADCITVTNPIAVKGGSSASILFDVGQTVSLT